MALVTAPDGWPIAHGIGMARFGKGIGRSNNSRSVFSMPYKAMLRAMGYFMLQILSGQTIAWSSCLERKSFVATLTVRQYHFDVMLFSRLSRKSEVGTMGQTNSAGNGEVIVVLQQFV